MGVKTETKEVNYCDCCGKKCDLPLTKCPICGRENCFTCSRQVYDVFSSSICQKCLKDETIHSYFMDGWRHWGKRREVFIKDMVKRFGNEVESDIEL